MTPAMRNASLDGGVVVIADRQNASPVTVTTLSTAGSPTRDFDQAQVYDGSSNPGDAAANNGGATVRLGYFDFGSSIYIQSVRARGYGLLDYGTASYGNSVKASIRGSNDLSTWATLWSATGSGDGALTPVNAYYRYIDFGPTGYDDVDGFTYIDCLEVVGEG